MTLELETADAVQYEGFHLEQLLEGPWDPHTMHIGGPFDIITGPTVFPYKRLHNVYISFFLFNVTTNTCHLKMHHSRPLKKKGNWSSSKGISEVDLLNVAYWAGFLQACIFSFFVGGGGDSPPKIS